MAKERLDKVLANMGYGSRKDVRKIVKAGEVTVNGIVAKDFSMHVDPENDVIEVDGEVLEYKKYIYVMLNKPQGVISATEDDYDETVVDILPDEYKIFRPAPVGRLDKDTEGLLILTNDGELNHLLLSPKRHVPKRYYAKIDGIVTQDDVEKFKEGVVLDDGYKTMPGELFILKSDEISEIELVIYEGKFHQVKRMFESVGKKVIYLKRIEMGPLKLDESLELGESRELTKEEVELLYNAVKK
ncbi:MAG: rRNA pseudouridine synthase [Clostridiales bacterium]|nr:rRNA pseudouridine synthase [Clostridiales bacterium]